MKTLHIQYSAEIYMLGYKAPRLEGMKSTSPLRCLLVKLNCIPQGEFFLISIFLWVGGTGHFQHFLEDKFTSKAFIS